MFTPRYLVVKSVPSIWPFREHGNVMTMLTISKYMMFIQMTHDVAINYDMFQRLACNAGEGNWPVVASFEPFPFLVNCRHIGCLPHFWYTAARQALPIDDAQFLKKVPESLDFLKLLNVGVLQR